MLNADKMFKEFGFRCFKALLNIWKLIFFKGLCLDQIWADFLKDSTLDRKITSTKSQTPLIKSRGARLFQRMDPTNFYQGQSGKPQNHSKRDSLRQTKKCGKLQTSALTVKL